MGGIAEGLLMKGGLYNSAPLKDFLKKELKDTKIQRSINVGIVDLLKGNYVDFNEDKL